MQLNEASPFRREAIESELNQVLDDIAKVLKEHNLSSVTLSIGVQVELTEDQASSIPVAAKEKLECGIMIKPVFRPCPPYC